jgi:hypothetical protein
MRTDSPGDYFAAAASHFERSFYLSTMNHRIALLPRRLGTFVASCAIALGGCDAGVSEVLHTGTSSSTGAGGSGSTSAATATGVGGSGSGSSSSSSATSGGTGGAPAALCKRGLGYGYNSVADLQALSPGVSWWYNWAPQPDSPAVAAAHAALGMEFVPMAWNEKDLPKLAAEVPADAAYLLGFNEPNFGNQANLTPEAAAAAWPQITAFAQQHGLATVSPAVNYCGSPCNETDPFVWLDKFFAACPGCKIDYIAMHWYACDKSALTWYLGQFESKYDKPLWLTEFACLDDPGDHSAAGQAAYLSDALTILENDPRVFRYAWFTGRSMNIPAVALLGADGQLTPLGKQYVTAPQTCKP